MTLSEFCRLKQQVVETILTSENHSYLLHSLKELFKEDINSVRRFEKISKIGQLLDILELRGVLSEDNVVTLKTIARKINNSELLEKVKKYEDCHVPREYGHYYESEKVNKSFLTETTVYGSPFEPSIMKKKKDRIIRTVVEEIGSYWKDLARSLTIREHFIDDIDHNHGTLATKALKMMEVYEKKADKQKWFFVLCESLDQIHRKDLAITLQEIMMMSM